jgi:hypothetical protein
MPQGGFGAMSVGYEHSVRYQEPSSGSERNSTKGRLHEKFMVQSESDRNVRCPAIVTIHVSEE